eukprot:761900-Hanusia_phi.AAC.5
MGIGGVHQEGIGSGGGGTNGHVSVPQRGTWPGKKGVGCNLTWVSSPIAMRGARDFSYRVGMGVKLRGSDHRGGCSKIHGGRRCC